MLGSVKKPDTDSQVQTLTDETLRKGVVDLHRAAAYYRDLAHAARPALNDQPEIARMFEDLVDTTCRTDDTIDRWSQWLDYDDRVSTLEAFLSVCEMVRKSGGSPEHLSVLDVANMFTDLAARLPDATQHAIAEIVAKRIVEG